MQKGFSIFVRALGLLCLLLGSSTVLAHKSSDAYLQISAGNHSTEVRWDIALRDLDMALTLDANEDGKLTALEINDAWPYIERYAQPKLQIAGCPLNIARHALERRNDGAYAVLFLESACALPLTPSITYTLFREVDPTHRGIAKIQRADQQVTLLLLDPNSDSPGDASTKGKGAATDAAPKASGYWAFLGEGIKHILTGYDHILFLLCLLLPAVLRRNAQAWQPVERLGQALWPIVGIVSAFTVAHSLTLALAAIKLISLSPNFIEPAIAVTIILAAVDNIWPIFPVPRIIVAFCFGLIHGFGFANVLTELNLPRADFIRALLQFNVGLEVGQLLIVISVSGALFLLRRRSNYHRWAIVGGSSVAMLLGLFWLIERTSVYWS